MSTTLHHKEQVKETAVQEFIEEIMQGFTGCTNHGCLITGGPKGMGTNSVCTCWRDPRMQVVLSKIRKRRLGK